jgi:hypothetical protein
MKGVDGWNAVITSVICTDMDRRTPTSPGTESSLQKRAEGTSVGSSQKSGVEPATKRQRVAGGAAASGGMNFQAAVTAIAYVYMARGRPLSWLDKVAEDVPISVEAETGGAGDDIRLLLKSSETVEVQVKKGLRLGAELWNSVTRLASAIRASTIDYGVLIVSPTSSNTITQDLANDLVRLGEGRSDNLSNIGATLASKLVALGLSVQDLCKRIRIQTVPALASDQAAILTARAELAHLCALEPQILSAWNSLYNDASALIEHRGRRDVSSVLRLLRAEGIDLADTKATAPATLLENLATWTLETNAFFTIFGVQQLLRTDEAWISLRAVVRSEAEAENDTLAEALQSYQAWEERSFPRDAVVVDPETLARFVTRAILVAGPGMGKTTLLKRIARRYSEDRIPVLRVRLAAVAARMRAGGSFEEAVFALGLDGSGIAASAAKEAAFSNWLLLCDGLDECGSLQEEVAAGATRFAAGHPGCRIIVTTRPFGYDTAYFGGWRHYDLGPLETSSAPAHLAMLVREIAKKGSTLHDDAYAVCRHELDKGEASKIVARSPLLLSLAASIIVRGGHLGATRERLYGQIFELVDEVPNSRVLEPPASAAVLRSILDILGWQITSHPLSPIATTIERCADDLVRETGEKVLAARGEAEAYLRYWQDVGIIERIGHGGDETLAFIHKSFGEFAAARHLRSMASDAQAEAIAAIVDAAQWAEVIRFAGLLGLANAVGNGLLAGVPSGSDGAKRIVRAVELMAEAIPPPERELRDRIVAGGFTVARSTRRLQAFDVGEPLVAAARRFPNEIGPSARLLLDHDQPWTRLIAWACTLAAGPDHYRLEDLTDFVRSSADAAGPSLEPSLGGGIILARGSGHDLAESFILEAAAELIDRCAPEVADAIVPDVLNNPDLGSVGFQSKARKLITEKGKTYQIDSLDRLDWPSLTPSKEYADALLIAYDAIFDALDIPDSATDEDEEEPGILLHFSAFLTASHFGTLPSTDVWAWTRSFDKAATREALKGFIGVSGIDREMLRRDGRKARRYLRPTGATEENWLFNVTTEVDPPAIDWAAAKTLGLDIAKIEAALYHPSQWIVWLAANLMEQLLTPPELEHVVQRLLEGGRRHTLWAASGLATELGQDRAVTLLFERLTKTLVLGCAHLFRLLQGYSLPFSNELLAAVRAGLLTGDVDTAIEAAKLASEIAEPGLSDLAAVLQDSLAHWAVREEPYPTKGGVVPPSPRAKLIQTLAKIRPPSYAELKAYFSDPRSDVKEIGSDQLVEQLRLPDGPRSQFLADIGAGKLPSHVLDKALKARIPLSADEIALAEGLLNSGNPKTRFGAMALLHKDYLDPPQIRVRAEVMTDDKEQQIKDRAFRILDAL